MRLMRRRKCKQSLRASARKEHKVLFDAGSGFTTKRAQAVNALKLILERRQERTVTRIFSAVEECGIKRLSVKQNNAIIPVTKVLIYNKHVQ
jgi:predicted site-specific integrase-resolvase